MLIHLNLTPNLLPESAIERARQATLDLVSLPFRKSIANALTHRVIDVKIGDTPRATVAQIPLSAHQWRRAGVIPWIDLRTPGARAIIDAIRVQRGYTWPVVIKHPDRPWWLIFSWDDLEAIVEAAQ